MLFKGAIPLIARELRVQARKPGTYYSRIGWGLLAIAALGIAVVDRSPTNLGGDLFAVLHGAFVTILALVAPLSTADAISRERRENTLGLLFLTPSRPRDVVLGKFASHVFRLVYFTVMSVPFLMLPLLAGGVSVEQFCITLLILASVLMTGAVVGLLTSAFCISFPVAIFAAVLSALFVNGLVTGIVTNFPLLFLLDDKTAGEYYFPWFFYVLMGPFFAVVPALFQEAATSILVAAPRHYTLLVAGGHFIVTNVFAVCALILTARRLSRLHQMKFESARQVALRRQLFSPIVWRSTFRLSLSRLLTRNPFAWLEYRAAWTRVARLLFVLAIIVVEIVALFFDQSLETFIDAQPAILFMLVVAIALKSTAGFQHEKETGALEVLLVTPISESQFVARRLAAVFHYYMPAILTIGLFTLLATMWFQKPWPLRWIKPDEEAPTFSLHLWLSVLTLPAAGFVFALRCKSFLSALFLTVLSLAPAIMWWPSMLGAFWFIGNRTGHQEFVLLEQSLEAMRWPGLVSIAIYHIVAFAIFRRWAERVLRRRAFAF